LGNEEPRKKGSRKGDGGGTSSQQHKGFREIHDRHTGVPKTTALQNDTTRSPVQSAKKKKPLGKNARVVGRSNVETRKARKRYLEGVGMNSGAGAAIPAWRKKGGKRLPEAMQKWSKLHSQENQTLQTETKEGYTECWFLHVHQTDYFGVRHAEKR